MRWRTLIVWLALAAMARGEAMLQYFNTTWREITAKIPELAEAGYSALWLPPPTKGSGGLSVGYDLFDRFDLGSKDQRGSVRTRYGTEAELLELVETAHRFGIRVYFDNIMNHNSFDVPGYNADTPIDLYPGMVPEDFHLRLTEDGFYRKWDNTRSWGDAWQVMNLGLADLIDIAQEPGSVNLNFGRTEGATFPKIKFVRHPNNPEYYCYLPNGTYVGFGPTNGITTGLIASNQSFYAERVEDFLNRSARWLMDRTKADGLRLDAVKHIRADFFGATYGADKDTSDYGYLGQVQRQFNLTRGFSDANHRDTVFDTEKPRDDAMVFGEHLGEPPGYGPYIDAGMRLVDNLLRENLNGRLGNPWANLTGLDSPGGGGFSPSVAVMHAQSHDNDYAARRELQHAIYFTRAGLGLIYTDGNYHAETLGESGGAFPRHANTAFLGQWGDARVPNLLKIHDNFARGYQRGVWSDSDYLAYERIDKRENPGMSDADGVTMLILLNDNYASGQSRNITGNVSFPHTSPSPDSYLVNYSTYGGEFYKYASDLHNVIVPPGGYFVFSWRNPRASDLWQLAGGPPVTILQDGQPVGTMTYTRKDGPDGDPAFNPYGLPDTNTTDFAYSYTVPRVTNGSNLTFSAHADGSAENILLKLDGGVPLNNLNHALGDPRDHPPALSTDVFLGYEQAYFQHRIFPELFAAAHVARNTTGSAGAETYTTAGPLAAGSGVKFTDGDTASWLYHDPTGLVSNGLSQFDGTRLWAKSNTGLVGYRAFVYYTGNAAYPEGAGGQGLATTKTVEMFWSHDADGGSWWRSEPLPGDFTSASRYKIGLFKTSAPSWFPAGASEVSKIKKMLTVFAITNFNAATVSYRPHNDYGATATGLKEGFHVLRARPFLNRAGLASIYNTFTQTFYYDAERPAGEIKFPANNGDTIGSSEYGVVVRTDPTVTEVWYHLADSDAANDDSATGAQIGNGGGSEPFTDANANGGRDANEPFVDVNGNGSYDSFIAETWARATEVTPTPGIASPYRKEWRFNYVNIPASGSATIKVILRELSSAPNLTLTETAGHFTRLERTVFTAGPDERMFIAYPPSNGDTVGSTYVMKTYFTKALASGVSSNDLINRFLISIASSESGSTNNAVPQSRATYAINWDISGEYHELAYRLPNLYNDAPHFLHSLIVTHTRSNQPTLLATRFVKAYPEPAAPYIAIVTPPAVDSDGQPYQIILPDVPSSTPEQRQFAVRVATGTAASNVVIHIDYAPPTSSSAMVLTNLTAEGSSLFWDYLWTNLVAGSYTFTATVTTTNGATATVQRNTTVVFRQLVDENPADTDDDDDGLLDMDETTAVPLPNLWVENPKANSDTWLNGDVHIHYAYGKSNPLSPDSDGDGLPDGLEVGWRNPVSTDTDRSADTNGDGWPNFIGDLDPPFFNTLDNYGLVPGVNSAAAGGNRARQVAGTMTDPLNPDTDGDGLPDGIEDANRNGWVDGDGAALATNAAPSLARHWPNGKMDGGETWTETSPVVADSDADGLSDGYGEDKNLNGRVDIGLIDGSGVVTGMLANPPVVGGQYSRRIDRPALFAQFPNAVWLETDPLNPDTDGDGLPDGWEVQYGLDPWDDGIPGHTNMNTGAIIASTRNGAAGDPDADGFDNLTEFTNGSNPLVPDTGQPPPPNQIIIGPVTIPVVVGSVTNRREFTDWQISDLIALDEYDGDGPNNQQTDVYRGWDGFDSSRDLVAFYAHDGGDPVLGGDGQFYFRVDLHDLQAYAEDGYLDIYVVINTGNPGNGEYNLPDDLDTGTDLKWQAVVACYGRNFGRVYVDTQRGVGQNTTAIGQNLASFGVVARDQNTANGFGASYYNSTLDAVEFSISRQALLDAGWNGLDAADLLYQVFTTKDGTANNPVGPGDIGGRSDIRDSIYDDWIASDYWKDQVNIAGNKSVLKSWFGKKAANDCGKRSKVITLIHGNQAIKPGSDMQQLINTAGGAGYYRPLDVHQAYTVPLALHVTPTLASAIQWAKVDPGDGQPWRDGPTFNARVSALAASNTVALIGTTFSDHILPYFDTAYHSNNVALAAAFLTGIYGQPPSAHVFFTPERVVDTDVLAKVATLGAGYTFIDQMRHLTKWFGRSSALGNDGYRLNLINGVRCFVINDQASTYRFLNHDGGLNLPLRALLQRKARSSAQDQVVILFSDWSDFTNKTQADAYDVNLRWLASRPWIQLVTPQQIAAGEVDLSLPPDGTGDAWGNVNRGTQPSLRKVAHDWIDHATQEDYDQWYIGSAQEEGLRDKVFNIRSGVPLPAAFGMQATGTGLIGQAWASVTNVTVAGLAPLAQGALHAATFITAYHNQQNNDLSKFSTGDYIYPDTDYNTLADFAKHAQAQARFAAGYQRVHQWAVSPPTGTVKSAEDVDLDGENEYLLYNDRLFAVFERSGGRLVGAWARDVHGGGVFQVIGNPLSYANTGTEDEGATNLAGGAVAAHRTSGFKDWWAVGPNTAQYVNDLYTVNDGGETGWRLRSSDNRISKTITLAPNSDRLEARYELTGPITQLYIRHGLSPDLLDLLINGQANLSGPALNTGKVTVANTNASAIVVTALGVSDTGHSNVTWNAAATDKTNIWATITMRNQAQTQQVELQGTATVFSFGLQLSATDCTADPDDDGLSNCDEAARGTNPTLWDTDGDGMNDGWEAQYRDPLVWQDGNVDPDGDGLTDLQESLAGTHPDDPASVLRILRITRDAATGDVTIQWTSVPGKFYRVVAADTMAGPFEPLRPGWIKASGAMTSDIDYGTAAAFMFYKVQVQTP